MRTSRPVPPALNKVEAQFEFPRLKRLTPSSVDSSHEGSQGLQLEILGILQVPLCEAEFRPNPECVGELSKTLPSTLGLPHH
jgi:hypothetical protein